jgi:2'-5' RNA ligase
LLSADAASFPVEPPADTRDPAVTAAHDWAAFSALDEMTDHWARPGWADGNRAYYWMLTFPDDQPLMELARHCQEELAFLGLDPVPRDGLHITLAGVGRPESVTVGQLEKLARHTEPLLPPAFTVRGMPLAGSRGAVRLSLGPWEPLVQLHHTLAEVAGSLGLAPKRPTSAFRPHLSLAYNNRGRPARPVVKAVSGLRALPAVELTVSAVRLVELRREGRTYRWDVLKALPLGRSTGVRGL